MNFLSKKTLIGSCVCASISLTVTFLFLVGVINIPITRVFVSWLHLLTISSTVVYVICVVARLNDLESQLMK